MVIIEDFLTEQEADLFKNFHIDNFNKLTDVQKKTHRSTEIIKCERMISDYNEVAFKFLHTKLTNLIQYHSKNSIVNYTEIVKWPKGERQPSHKDFDFHTYTSIIYLNDDFVGGETKVENQIIKPKKGKLILFDGSKLNHEVLEIKEGVRYTNATWYISLR